MMKSKHSGERLVKSLLVRSSEEELEVMANMVASSVSLRVTSHAIICQSSEVN